MRPRGIIPACAGSTRLSRPPRRRRRDHPRMRGEHERASSPRTLSGGSSPHARGALTNTQGIKVGSGIIPACAGSTPAVVPARLAHGDHPRMRGEHRGPERPRLPARGSSPHARGALAPHWPPRDARRIIPACAGSTSRLASLAVYSEGSSPHARGALVEEGVVVGRHGIIPACAGSTGPPLRRSRRRGDHPRMRGEHQ